jgi:PBSX family phage terminase large subunit
VYQCPFGAISDKSFITKAIEIVKKSFGNKVYHTYAVVAPSIGAQYADISTEQVYEGILKLGFYRVEEAAWGADAVAYHEAQELVDEALFDVVDNSIRDANTTNEVWLVLNPTDIDHWIIRRFFTEKGLEVGFNGVKDGVRYIHTTYLDNAQHLDRSFIEKAERLKETNPEKYDNIYLGHPMVRKAGLIYPRWEEIAPEEYPTHLDQWYGNDWGYGGDPNALLRMCYDALTQTIYLWEVCCTQLITLDVAKVIKEDARSIGYEPEQCLVYCDPARPDNIVQLRRSGISAVKAVNRDKAGRISYLQGFKVKYVGESIRREVRSYSWQPHPQDLERFTDKPQDGMDHCMDAASYGAVTHLRRMGILNEDGES